MWAKQANKTNKAQTKPAHLLDFELAQHVQVQVLHIALHLSTELAQRVLHHAFEQGALEQPRAGILGRGRGSTRRCRPLVLLLLCRCPSCRYPRRRRG